MNITGFTYGTDYVLLQNPPSRVYVEQGKLRGERTFRLFDYTKHPAFLAALAGGVAINGTQSTYIPPAQYSPNVNIWCLSASHEGLGVGSKQANGEETFSGGAKVPVGYGTLSYDPSQKPGDNQPAPGPFITEARSTGGNMIVLAKKNADGSYGWKWNSDSVKLNEDAPDIIKVQCEGSYALTRHNVAVFPKTTINGLIGKINLNPFPNPSSLGSYDSGDLLFLGDESEREFLSDGSTKAWTIALKFAYNPNGWNELYRPDTQQYETVISATGSKFMFTVADFAPLLGS